MCLDACTGSWIRSFATASCLSCRFLFLLSLLLPEGLPVCAKAEKHFPALFWKQSGLHSGQNLGVNNVSDGSDSGSGTGRPLTWTCEGLRTWCLSLNVFKILLFSPLKLWLKWIYFAFRFQTAPWSGACWRTRRRDEPSWWVAACTCSSRFRESTPSCEWRQTSPLRPEFRVKKFLHLHTVHTFGS